MGMSIRIAIRHEENLTDDRIRKTQGPKGEQLARRQDHAFPHVQMSSKEVTRESRSERTYASRYGWANASSTEIRFLGSNVYDSQLVISANEHELL
jgi:hypothetical protein